jgi:hypothetical protein
VGVSEGDLFCGIFPLFIESVGRKLGFWRLSGCWVAGPYWGRNEQFIVLMCFPSFLMCSTSVFCCMMGIVRVGFIIFHGVLFFPPMARQPLVVQSRIIEASRSHSDTPHSVGLLWSTTHNTHKRQTPCSRRDSNPPSAGERPQTMPSKAASRLEHSVAT